MRPAITMISFSVATGEPIAARPMIRMTAPRTIRQPRLSGSLVTHSRRRSSGGATSGVRSSEEEAAPTITPSAHRPSPQPAMSP